MTKLALTAAGLTACSFAWAPAADADILLPQDITIVSVQTTKTSLGTVTPASADQIDVRQRSNFSTTDARTTATFVKFDLSAYSPGDIASAVITLDYTTRLNDVNASAPASVGRALSDWDTSGTNNPLFSYGFDNATQTTTAADVQIVQDDIVNTAPPVNQITVDITSIVQGWVDGSFDDNGLVFFINGGGSQGAGFSNLELEVTEVPEPGSLALLGLGGLLIARRRRNG